MPDASGLSISSTSDRPAPALSGLAISFGKTLQYLPDKTVTRRTWKDSHAQKFINAFKQHKLVKALDKDVRYGGKQIGWCRLLCAPYKEQLSAMPDGDLAAEGGMCSSVQEFIQQYFKGNSNLEVWVIRFEFIASLSVLDLEPATVLNLPAESESQTNSSQAIASPIESIHQTSLTVLGVYSNSDNKTNNILQISSPTNSIHQAPLTEFGVYSNFASTTDSNYPINSPIDSIHQAATESRGVCFDAGDRFDTNPAIPSATESIHQAPLIQGGNGLVYTFWKGESLVNHYRYKVKVNGKWKVRSVYIPVGKLPKVREAIANNLGVERIVVEILSGQL